MRSLFTIRILLSYTDSDGLLDSDEMAMGADPNDPDSDGDGLEDDEVYVWGFSDNPTVMEMGRLRRSICMSLSPLIRTAMEMGLKMQKKYIYETDPAAADSDPDDLPDDDEIFFTTPTP